MPESTDQASNQDAKPEFKFVRLYLKDASFETPHSPDIFIDKWDPEISVRMDITKNRLENDFHEVVLDITVTAKQGERTAYLCEIKQAGIFFMKNLEDAYHNQMLNVFCPDTLFPFAREAITDIITKGGFPQLLVTPVDFDHLYQHELTKTQAPVETMSNQDTLSTK